MALLGTDAYKYLLASSLADARTSLSLISAYITTGGIRWVLNQVSHPHCQIRVLARWNCDDLVSGASDLEVFELLGVRGASLFILQGLHAKVMLVDEQDLFVSSANVTGNGLRLGGGGNHELGVKLAAYPEDIAVIEGVFAEAVQVTPTLYGEIRDHVELTRKQIKPQKRTGWPVELLQKLKKAPEHLWVSELFWSDSPQLLSVLTETDTANHQAVWHDLNLLGLNTETQNGLDKVVLRERFLESRAWKWLLARLIEAQGQEMYFGRLTAALHDALLDDPKPYRQDVKTLVANLVKWTDELGDSSVIVDRPNHSQRLRLK
jgi:hypothetical protein